MRSIEEMLPSEIIAARDNSGCAFVPISPAFEWHSYHLPLGTDGLIAEGLCRLAARETGGVYFRVLSFGLDAWRTDAELAHWGFQPGERVFGMNFPGLPVRCEYAQEAEMVAALSNRLRALVETGFRWVFVVNHHGGKGQAAVIEKTCREFPAGDGAKILPVRVNQFATLARQQPEQAQLRVGGHAGMLETLQLAAFRPELVDLHRLPEGELKVREMGILHSQPVIEAEANPRNALLALANDYREDVLQNFLAYIELLRQA